MVGAPLLCFLGDNVGVIAGGILHGSRTSNRQDRKAP